MPRRNSFWNRHSRFNWCCHSGVRSPLWGFMHRGYGPAHFSGVWGRRLDRNDLRMAGIVGGFQLLRDFLDGRREDRQQAALLQAFQNQGR